MPKHIIVASLITFIAFEDLAIAKSDMQNFTLQQAINTALHNSEKNKISNYDLQIANEQYKQAISANFPSLDLEIGAIKKDEDFINITKGEIALPKEISNTLALISAPDAQKPLVQQAIATNQIPQVVMPLNYESIVMGDTTVAGKLKLTYPLYSGGKISALQKQAKINKEIAQINQKSTKEEIIFSVKKYYYGSILAQQITNLLEETSFRMDALNDLTKSLYNGGSEHVKKTDYYRTQIASSAIKAFYSQMQTKTKLAKSALLFAMGIDQQSKINLTNDKQIIQKPAKTLKYWIQTAYKNNKKLAKINKALKIYDAKIDESKSEYKPNIALLGTYEKLHNNYDGGLSNAQNDTSWSVGIGAKWNLFNGFRTDGKVSEAKLAKLKLKEQKKLLKNAIALQVKKAYFEAMGTTKQLKSLDQSVKSAQANRDLNTRAYQADMVKTKDVVEAQITEAQIKAKYFQTYYNHLLSYASLEQLAGK